MKIKSNELPYYAVIFTSKRTAAYEEEYAQMSKLMEEAAIKQSGFLGLESARNDMGITISYWKSTEAIKKWKNHTDHLLAQHLGRTKWYSSYHIRVCKIEREYNFELP